MIPSHALPHPDCSYSGYWLSDIGWQKATEITTYKREHKCKSNYTITNQSDYA